MAGPHSGPQPGAYPPRGLPTQHRFALALGAVLNGPGRAGAGDYEIEPSEFYNGIEVYCLGTPDVLVYAGPADVGPPDARDVVLQLLDPLSDRPGPLLAQTRVEYPSPAWNAGPGPWDEGMVGLIAAGVRALFAFAAGR